MRINPVGSSCWVEDLGLAKQRAIAGVVVPKLERAADLALLTGVLDDLGLQVPIIAGIETVLGVLDVRSLLLPPVAAAYFGAEDLVFELGGQRTPEGVEVLYARSRVALAARAAGVAAIDQAVLEVNDKSAYMADAQMGLRLGYQGKICVHPRQVGWAHAAFTPAPAEVERSLRLIAAYDAATAAGQGAIDFEGMMVDAPVAARARNVLARAGGQSSVLAFPADEAPEKGGP